MLKKLCQSTRSKRQWVRASLLGGFITSVAGLPSIGHAQITPMRTPTLVSAPAGSAAYEKSPPRLQVYDVPSEFIGPVGAQLQVRYHGDSSIRVTTDPNSGQLMIMAPDAVHREIGRQITGFMQQNKIPAGDRGVSLASYQQQTYTLRNLSWRELEDALQRLTAGRMSVTTERNGELANLQMTNPSGRQDILQVDRRQNRVTLLGSGPTVAAWTAVMHSLDEGQVDQRNQTQIVPLSPAEPRRVKKAIHLVRATIQDEASGQAQAQIDVGADERAMAMGSIESLGADSGLFGDVQIEFIEEIDLVIVRGAKRDVQRVLEVIEKIKEQALETQPEVEVLPLQYANNEAVAALVTQLYETVYAPRQGSVSITPLVQPNALLIIGRKEVVQSVKDLVKKIDQPLDAANQLKVIPLQYASSVDVEARIREFFVNKPGGDDADRPGVGTRVKVLADYRTNSLIIQAAPREMVEVEELINRLDVESATNTNTVQVFRLRNTTAEELAEVIQEVIGGTATGGDASQVTPPSGKLSIVSVDGSKVESGILAGVIITADPTVNALVVRAPAPSMALIAKLIEELDQLPSAEALIKVFQLRNGDATTLAQTLQGLFGLAVTAGQGAQGNLLSSISRSNLTTGGEGSLVQLQIAAEARTNSIVVSGSKSDLTVLEALVLRLDEDVVESRRSEVIWLRNATADNVAIALSGYFDQLNLAQQNLNNGVNLILSAQELVNRRVFVIPEPATNSLLLSASPDYFDAALALIERLDRRPPMVAVQVLVAEMQLNDSFELGAEWGLQDGLLFDRLSATGGTLSSPVFGLGAPLTGPSGAAGALGLTQNVAAQGLSSFGVGRTNSAGQGGLVLSASSEAVGVLIRALQTANRLQVLNRPQLTTLDGQPATAQVGQSVPRVTGITQQALGTPQQILTEDEDVGLLLSVLPRVNADGLILMQVGVENSSVGDPNAGIPIGFGANGEVIRSPIINRTRAETVVSAYSGQTVVFAGLINKQRQSTRSQIPFLGSIPWIGAAFRFDVETEQRRELLVVLTPRLIQTDEDYDTLKQVESSRMSWCLADVLNIHGDVGLSGGNGLWGPAKSAVIYPELPAPPPADRSNLRTPADYPGNYGPNQYGPNQFGPGGYGPIDYAPGFPVPADGGLIEPAPGLIEQPTLLDSEASLRRQQSVFQQASFARPQTLPPSAPGTRAVGGQQAPGATTGGVGPQIGSYR